MQLEAHHVVEKALAADEREPTIGVLVFSSGMGAISTLLLSLLRSGDTVLAGNVYGSTDSLLRGLSKFGIDTVFCDTGQLAQVERALDANPRVRVLFLESPDNPTLRLSDIEAISRLTEKRGVVLVVDNTFCSPFLQQPFRLGADFVVHSLTKFVNGHSTSMAGAVLGPYRSMRDDVFPWYRDLGPTPSPFDSWLNAMTIQSLAVREQAQCESAAEIARFLQRHAGVARVFYPGLADSPQAEIARKQMRNGGALISFEVAGGSPAAERLMNYFARKDTPMELAVSLGSAISYIQHPLFDDARRSSRSRSYRSWHHARTRAAVGRARGNRDSDRAPGARAHALKLTGLPCRALFFGPTLSRVLDLREKRSVACASLLAFFGRPGAHFLQVDPSVQSNLDRGLQTLPVIPMKERSESVPAGVGGGQSPNRSRSDADLHGLDLVIAADGNGSRRKLNVKARSWVEVLISTTSKTHSCHGLVDLRRRSVPEQDEVEVD